MKAGDTISVKVWRSKKQTDGIDIMNLSLSESITVLHIQIR